MSFEFRRRHAKPGLECARKRARIRVTQHECNSGNVIKLVYFLKGQGVINATDLALASSAVKISSNGKHIVGWTAVDGYFGSFRITLDQIYVCDKGKSQRVGYPGAVSAKLAKGATLGMCEADRPLQYK
jgi:hypothetical protein